MFRLSVGIICKPFWAYFKRSDENLLNSDSAINLQLVNLNNRTVIGFYITKTLDIIGYAEYKFHVTAMSLSLYKAKKKKKKKKKKQQQQKKKQTKKRRYKH